MEIYEGDNNELVADLSFDEIEDEYGFSIRSILDIQTFVSMNMNNIISELATEFNFNLHPHERVFITDEKSSDGEMMLSIHFPDIPYDSIDKKDAEADDINDKNTYIYRFENIYQMSEFSRILNLDSQKYDNIICYSTIYKYDNAYILLLIMPFSEMEVSKHMEYAKGLCYQPVIKNKKSYRLMLNEHGEIIKDYDELPVYQLIEL